MPAYKEEQFDPGTDTSVSPRARTRGTNPPTRPSRNVPQRRDNPQQDFYSDEHPEIPKILRASLYLDSSPPSTDPPATKAKEVETEHIRHAPSTQRQKIPDESQKQYAKPMSQTVRPARPRPKVEAPPSSLRPVSIRDPRRRKPQYRQSWPETRWPFLSQLAQRQHWLKMGGAAIGVLLALVVTSNLLHNVFSQVPGIVIIPGISNNSTTSTDPHALVITPVNTDHPAPPVYAQGAYLLDADTGATLYASNPFAHLPIMSTTKLMTALLAVEHGNLDQTVTINQQMANDISQLPADSFNIGLKAGESYTLRQLMYGMLLASGNDAAVAVADAIGGTYANFIAMMNQKAADLGLHDTHFENPNGLQQDNHYSCAHDMAIIGLNSLSNPTIRQISSTLTYNIDQTPQHAAHDFFNGDQFIWWYPGVDAGKPGYDDGTNFVQVISCVHNGHHLIGVTIHTIDWWTDMRDLMNWGFNTYTWVSPRDLNTPDHPIPYANLWNNFAGDTQQNTIPTADHGKYYIYTGYSITGNIENYFNTNGGLTSFGFPLSQPTTVAQNTLRQRFQHGTIQCNTQNNQCQKGM